MIKVYTLIPRPVLAGTVVVLACCGLGVEPRAGVMAAGVVPPALIVRIWNVPEISAAKCSQLTLGQARRLECDHRIHAKTG